MSMKDESYLRLLLAGGASPSQASHSQASPLVSAIPIGPPPAPRVQAPSPERHWSTGAIHFLLSQCKEHVELYNTITMWQLH